MPEWFTNGIMVFAGIIVTSAIAYLTTRLTSKTQKETATIEARGPEWQSFVAEIRQQNADTKQELNEKIDGLQTQVTGLKTEVRSMRGKLTQAMWHIYAWRQKHPNDHLVESLPAELHEDLPFDHGSF